MVQKERRRWLKCELQMKKLPLEAFYLGSPLFSSNSKTKDFKYLNKRVESRLKGWQCKCLSWAGRNTMIKSVAQALPTYTFSTIDIPTSVWKKLDSVTRHFWWNPKKEIGNYLAWKLWDLPCQPKVGGLGFRQSKNLNCAMLVELTWMIASKRDSLCMRALHGKYKVRAD